MYFKGTSQEVKDFYEKIEDGYQCKVCGKTSEIQNNIFTHVETNHYSPGYPCDLCGKNWNTRHNFQRHLRNCKESHGIEIPSKSETDLEVAKFTESVQGNPMLLDKEGHPFKTSVKRGRKIYWICRDRVLSKCPASAVTDGIHVIKFAHTHNHPLRPNTKNYDRKYQIQDKKSKKAWSEEPSGNWIDGKFQP